MKFSSCYKTGFADHMKNQFFDFSYGPTTLIVESLLWKHFSCYFVIPGSHLLSHAVSSVVSSAD